MLFSLVRNTAVQYYCLSAQGLRTNDSQEYKLRQELLGNMDVMVRPVKSYSDAVNVSFSLILKALQGLVGDQF